MDQEERDVRVAFNLCEKLRLHLRLRALQISLFALVALIHPLVGFLVRSQTVVALAVEESEHVADVVKSKSKSTTFALAVELVIAIECSAQHSVVLRFGYVIDL